MTRGVAFLGVIGVALYLMGAKASTWRLPGPARTFLLGHVVFQIVNILVIICQSGYAKNPREASESFDQLCFDKCLEESTARQWRTPVIWKSSVGAACHGCDFSEQCKLAKR